MSDSTRDPSDVDYDHELTASREEVAAVLGGVVDGVLAGGIRLGDGADAVSLDVPEEVSLEVDVEAENDEVSLELELEWPTADGGPVSAIADQSGGPDEESVLAAGADGSQMGARFELFSDRQGEWRWRLRHRNGNIIAVSGEGYTRKHDARKGLRSVVTNAPDAEVREESPD